MVVAIVCLWLTVVFLKVFIFEFPVVVVEAIFLPF